MDNLEQNEMVENQTSGTPTEQVSNDVKVPTSVEQVQQPIVPSFTQDQVNDIVRERLSRIYSRYDVQDSNGLDELIGKSQAYSVMKSRYDANKRMIFELQEELAFLKNDIEPSRYDDVRAYFRGKEIEFNHEALANEIVNHPEWKRVIEKSNDRITTIKSISPDRNVSKVSPNEKDEVAKLFGFKNGFVR